MSLWGGAAGGRIRRWGARGHSGHTGATRAGVEDCGQHRGDSAAAPGPAQLQVQPVSYCTEGRSPAGLCSGQDQWSPHIGKFTKVNTLNSVMMEKQRNTPYRKRHPQPSFLSSCHLFRWTPNTWGHREAQRAPGGGIAAQYLRGDPVSGCGHLAAAWDPQEKQMSKMCGY